MNEILMPRSSLPTLYVQPGFKLVQRDHPDDPTMVFVSMEPDMSAQFNTRPGQQALQREDWTPLGQVVRNTFAVQLSGDPANWVTTDDIAALVKAARAVVDVGFPTHDCEHGPTIDALEAALKPFERSAR